MTKTHHKNDLLLRRNRDDGLHTNLKDEEADLLAFRMDAGEEDSKYHFNSCNRNSTVISKNIDNEVIDWVC
ncbi:hypothetical protein PR048_023643 [Dryococelus australis]|uniref:Uncharacterized protein n=1 Tax=Dryococelus australis TaxID=614101 RepID=A0ABQ9GUQ8_9NEOP|nr:hypothetical protein PR048_023643 [Dryococelus australis]